MSIKSFGRAFALGSVSLFALSGVAQAQIVQLPKVSNLRNLTYQSVGDPIFGGGECRVFADFDLRGQTNDGAGEDIVEARLTDGSANRRLDSGQRASVPVNSNGTFNRYARLRDITATNAVSNMLFYAVFDIDSAGVVRNQLATIQVDLNDMAAAGGFCASTANAVAGNGGGNNAPDAVVAQSAITTGGTLPVTLDASGSSDPDGDALTYQWTQTGGTSVTINNSTAAVSDFTAPQASATSETLTFNVTVTDPAGDSDVATVTVTIPANQAPIARTNRDATIDGGDRVELDGTASTDANGDALTYAWVQLSGPSVTIDDAGAATTSFIAPPRLANAQVLEFELTVTDVNGAQSTDQVSFTLFANTPPNADAGADRTVTGNSVVTIDARASSDGDGDALTYSFTQTSGTSVHLTDNGNGTATFTAPQGGASAEVLAFEVTVEDGIATVTDTVEITVAPNSAPIAAAGADQGPVDSGTLVTLNGAGSSDPEGDALTYSWTQVSGTSVTLSSASAANPTFTAPLVAGTEDLVFELTVNDGQVTSAPDRVTISIRAQGTVTIVQNIVGDDTIVTYTTNVPGLANSIQTSGGSGTATVANVTAGNYSFSVDDLRSQGYALTALSCDDDDSQVSLANASIAIALAPSENLVCTIELSDTRSAENQAIGEFLGGRNALLMNSEPSRQRRFDRLNGMRGASGSARVAGLSLPGSNVLPFQLDVSASGTSIRTSLAMADGALGREATRAFDIWFEGQIADARLSSNEGSFKVGHLGADYLVSEGVLVGAMVSLDRFDQEGTTLLAGQAEGDGWMAGPYVTAKLDETLYVDARVAYGRSDNSVSPLGTFVDAFDTSRLFASAAVTGDVDLGDGFKLWPEASVRYLRESVDGYVDTLGVAVADFSIDQGEIGLRPRLEYVSIGENGWSTMPYAEFEGILTFGAEAFSAVGNGLRGRAAAGIDAASPDGLRLGVSGFYDGIGEDDYRALGARVTIGMSF